MTQRPFIEDFLKANQIGVMATNGVYGVEAATIFYVTEDASRLYYKSRTASNHAASLIKANKAALCVYDHNSTYVAKTGVQLLGNSGRVLDAAEMEKVVALYSQRFGEPAAKKLVLADLLALNSDSTFYWFDITAYKLVSHELAVHSPEYQAW